MPGLFAFYKRFTFAVALGALLLLAACAPENLDITPTPTPTNTPQPTNTPLPTRTPAPTPEGGTEAGTEATNEASAAGDGSDAGAITTESMTALLPQSIPAGAFTWRRAQGDPQAIPNVAGGSALRVNYSEAGGSQAEITFGVFESAEAAQAYYEAVIGRVRTLEGAETRDDLPRPNAFGSGTYGSDAVILRENVYIRVSIPQFSSTAGNPLLPLARAVNEIADGALGASS